MAGVRRVVTGHSDGKSVFLQDGQPPTGAGALAPIWATDASTRMGEVPADPTESMGSWIPGPGETRFHMVVIPPATEQQPAAAPRTPPPGFETVMENETPGMHTTQTVDYDVIISGSMLLELDDGKEVELHPGDVVIQNGTRHAWRNRGTEPCVMYAVMVGVPKDG